MAEPETAVTSLLIKLPSDLVDWLDIHVAELRVALIRAGKRSISPSRNTVIRETLQRLRNEHKNNHK